MCAADSEDGTLLAVARRGGAVQLLAAGTGAAAGTLPKPSAPTTSPSQDAADVAAMAYLTQQASRCVPHASHQQHTSTSVLQNTADAHQMACVHVHALAHMTLLLRMPCSSTSKIITCTKGGVLSVFSSSSTIGEASTSGRSWECAHSSQRMSSILAMVRAARCCVMSSCVMCCTACAVGWVQCMHWVSVVRTCSDTCTALAGAHDAVLLLLTSE